MIDVIHKRGSRIHYTWVRQQSFYNLLKLYSQWIRISNYLLCFTDQYNCVSCMEASVVQAGTEVIS